MICDCHLRPTRRGLFGLAAGATATGFLVRPARAASVTALAITCIDYRLVDDAVTFFNGRHMAKDYDQVSLAGASLAAVSPKFPSSNAAFWDHIGIAKQLHHIRKVVVVDHRDCGAFKVAFGKDYQGVGAAETAQHKTIMEQVKTKLTKTHPDLAYEAWLMAVDGKAERVV